MNKKLKLTPYLLFAPTFALFAWILFYPWAWSLVLSLHEWSPIRRGARMVFVGLENYVQLLVHSRDFQISVRDTLSFSVIATTLQFLIGTSVAVMLSRKDSRIYKIFTIAFLLPMFLTPAMVGLMWRVLLHGQWGIVNHLFTLVGLGRVDFLGDPANVFFTIVGVEVWQNWPFVMLIMLAGLRAISPELVEAAVVDGANQVQVYRLIIAPIMKPLIVIVILFRLMFSLRAFGTIYALFPMGGPGQAGRILGIYLYDNFRMTWEVGISVSISYIMLIIAIALSMPLTLTMYKDVE